MYQLDRSAGNARAVCVGAGKLARRESADENLRYTFFTLER